MDQDELKERLTPVQYRVTQEADTEPPGSGEYEKHKEPGEYHCVVCDEPLFRSDEKYDSGSGWPSFWQPGPGANVEERLDKSLTMIRTETVCGGCGAHLGHLFPDGPEPTGKRYCINSAALHFVPGSRD